MDKETLIQQIKAYINTQEHPFVALKELVQGVWNELVHDAVVETFKEN